jgi:fructosamine-3-kinase
MNVAGVELVDARPIGGGDICAAFRATTRHGRVVFAKTLPAAPSGFFAAEAAGLDLLRGAAAGPAVPDVVAVGDDGLVLEWVDTTSATADAAARFGAALARMHGAAMPEFGADADGFIGPLPLPNEPCGDWPSFYVERRLRPYVDALTRDQRAVVEAVIDRIDELAGPAEAPARVHGDLWSGNLVWGRDGRVWLVDAASAHGGHRETDLAMLAWFGAPHLEVMLAAYDETAPLAPGWRERVPLHQLHPMLVHATLFGGGYGERAASAAHALVAG